MKEGGRGFGRAKKTALSATASAAMMMDPDGSYNEAPQSMELTRQDRAEQEAASERIDNIFEALNRITSSKPQPSAPKSPGTGKSKSGKVKRDSPASSPRAKGKKGPNRSRNAGKIRGPLKISSIHLSPSSPKDDTENTDVSDVTTPISNPPTPKRKKKTIQEGLREKRGGSPRQLSPSPSRQKRQLSIRDLLEDPQGKNKASAPKPPSVPGLEEISHDESETSMYTDDASQDTDILQSVSHLQETEHSQTTAQSTTTEQTPSTVPGRSQAMESVSSSSGIVQFSPIKPMPVVPSLHLKVAPPAIVQDRDVFPLLLPTGPTGLVFMGLHPPMIKSVKPTSPLSGILEAGYFVIGLNVPEGSSKKLGSSRNLSTTGSTSTTERQNLGGQTYSHLTSKELQLALRNSARRAMRTLWFSKRRNPSIPSSMLANTSSLHQRSISTCSKFVVTSAKCLVSLPPGDLGMSLLGNPPLITSIDDASPLDGLIHPAEHYVLGLFSPKSGKHHRSFDSAQLESLLQFTRREKGRILVVTSDPNELPTHESDTSSSEASKKSQERSDTQSYSKSDTQSSYWSSGVLAKANSEKGVGSVQVVGHSPEYYATSSSTPEEVSRKGTTPQHIILKKTWVHKTFKRPYHVLSFHGKAMDWNMANRIQYGLKDISTKKAEAPLVEKGHDKTALEEGGKYSVILPHDFGKHHEEDAMASILDALASMGWVLQHAYADNLHSGKQGFSNEKFILHKV